MTAVIVALSAACAALAFGIPRMIIRPARPAARHQHGAVPADTTPGADPYYAPRHDGLIIARDGEVSVRPRNGVIRPNQPRQKQPWDTMSHPVIPACETEPLPDPPVYLDGRLVPGYVVSVPVANYQRWERWT